MFTFDIVIGDDEVMVQRSLRRDRSMRSLIVSECQDRGVGDGATVGGPVPRGFRDGLKRQLEGVITTTECLTS